MTGLGLAITIASIWAVIAFGLVGLFIYRYCKFCRIFSSNAAGRTRAGEIIATMEASTCS